MNCQRCGNSLEQDALFCGNCGVEIQAITPTVLSLRIKDTEEDISTELITDPQAHIPTLRVTSSTPILSQNSSLHQPSRPKPGTLIETLRGHTSEVNAIAWSPDGTKIVSSEKSRWNFFSPTSKVSNGNIVIVWDSTTGRLLTRFEEHTGEVNAVAWSPDSSKLASGGEGGIVKVWDPITGKVVNSTSIGEGAHSVTWSPDGVRLAIGDTAGYILVWDTATRNRVTKLKKHTLKGSLAARESPLHTIIDDDCHINAVAWSPDGVKLASAGIKGIVSVWDTTTGKLVAELKKRTIMGHTGEVYSITWSPDGSKIAAAYQDKTVKVWDTNTESLVSVCRGHSWSVYSVAWSPDGTKIASGSYEKTVRIWDPITGKQVAELWNDDGKLNSVSWSPDGTKIAAGSEDKTVKVWQTV